MWILTLVHQHLVCRRLPEEHRVTFDERLVAIIVMLRGMCLLVVALYFKDGEGPQGEVNVDLWARAHRLRILLGMPSLIAGDFNMDPGELLQAG